MRHAVDQAITALLPYGESILSGNFGSIPSNELTRCILLMSPGDYLSFLSKGMEQHFLLRFTEREFLLAMKFARSVHLDPEEVTRGNVFTRAMVNRLTSPASCAVKVFKLGARQSAGDGNLTTFELKETGHDYDNLDMITSLDFARLYYPKRRTNPGYDAFFA